MSSSSVSNAIELGPNKNSSIYYGIRVPTMWFILYLMIHDEAFANDIVSFVHTENKAFRKYNAEDVIEDIWEHGGCGGSSYKRKNKVKSKDLQCADSMYEIPRRAFRISLQTAATCSTSAYAKRCYDSDIEKFASTCKSIHITQFPSCKIVYLMEDNDSCLFVGVEMDAYKDGVAVTFPPRSELVHIAQQLEPLIAWCANNNLPDFDNMDVSFHSKP